MATRSNILAWKIPWIEESGGPQSKESDMTERLSIHMEYKVVHPLWCEI